MHRYRPLLVLACALAAPLAGQAGWHARVSPAQTGELAFDPVNQRLFRFGGLSWGNSMYGVPHTWLGTSEGWMRVHTAAAPSDRAYTGLCPDPQYGGVLLFGGGIPRGYYVGGGRGLNDTWRWDGHSWQQASVTSPPPGRMDHAMAYDSARRRHVLFGGQDCPYTGCRTFQDTWEWDGTQWLQHTPVATPTGRCKHAMAYDSQRQRTVLFGGLVSWRHANDTWEWDGTNWQQMLPATRPVVSGPVQMAYDPARQRTVAVINGAGPQPWNRAQSETWEWDGVNWTRVHQNTPWADAAA